MTPQRDTPATPAPSPVEAVAIDRERIAVHLHDGVVQTLSAAGLRAELVRAVLGDAAPPEVGELLQALNEATRELRAVMDGLRRPAVATVGFARALRERVAEQDAGQRTSVLDDLVREPGEELAIGLLWLVEEAIRALRRTGNYGAITVTLRSSLTAFEVEVSAAQIASERSAALSLDGVVRLAALIGAELARSEPTPGVTCIVARADDDTA
jgi:signal transduction histidine kinase